MDREKFLESLKTTVIMDLTKISKDERQRWAGVYSFLNPEVSFAQTWFKDRLLMYPENFTALYYYESGMSTPIKNGVVNLMMGGRLDDEGRKIFEAKYPVKEDEIVLARPLGRKELKFEVYPITALNIVEAQPHPEETLSMLKTTFVNKINQLTEEIKINVGKLTFL